MLITAKKAFSPRDCRGNGIIFVSHLDMFTMNRAGLIFLLLVLVLGVRAQVLKVHVVDSIQQEAIVNAFVTISGTSISGYTNSKGEIEFRENQLVEVSEALDIPRFIHFSSIFHIQHSQILRVSVVSINGNTLYDAYKMSHSIDVNNFSPGVYMLRIIYKKHIYQTKFVHLNNYILCDGLTLWNHQEIAIVAEKNGYQQVASIVQVGKDNEIELSRSSYSNEDYLTTLDNLQQFRDIEGVPLNPFFGEVSSVKFLYDIKSQRIYFINSNQHIAHAYFAMDVLAYPKNNANFNIEQYHNGPNRLYYPGTIDFFQSSGHYVMQFFASDDITCEAIRKVYEKIQQTCYFKDELVFYANSIRTKTCSGMQVISSDELFEGQNYQCLNPEETYGYLRKVDFEELNNADLGRHDLVLLNGNPVDIAVVAGIITTEFQTPLSHINVLSINRKTPNIVVRDGWFNPDFQQHENKLVYLNATIKNFEIREANLDEAEAFWALREPGIPVVLEPDTLTSGIIELSTLSIQDVDLVGGKAANFAELAKVNGANGTIPLPEGSFCLPFYYYHQHMKINGIDHLRESILADPMFKTNLAIRKQKLKELRNAIKKAPLDADLLRLVENRIKHNSFKNTRFRSSTNAEDIDGFNGAGLYDSKTGIPGDKEKSVEDAIKKVWASLWNFRAFEERAYFKIDQGSVAMGILAHRSFPAEKANGVLITKNIYRDFLPAYTINCQFDEISVVNPEEGWQPEQILYYTFPGSEDNPINYLNYSNVIGYEGQRVMTEVELRLLHDHCADIVTHYASLGIRLPFDIEFKIDLDGNAQRKLYIKQCRIFND